MPETSTIAERLRAADRPTFSFEFFPPADDAALAVLSDTVERLEELRPDWVSITYGATGASRDKTFRAVETIAAHAPSRVVGHLTLAGQTTAELQGALASYAALGVEHVLALRGDPPGGPGTRFEPHPEGLRNATELVALAHAEGDFTVGVAAFPDGHPEGNPDLDAEILLAKEHAGATFAVTQLFFDAASYWGLVERFRALGGTMPIVAGIMPVTNVAQIERFGRLSGKPMPAAFTHRLLAVGEDAAAFRAVGIELMTQLCDDLLAAGAPGLQFFTLNRSPATREILANLRQIPPHRG